MENKSKGLVIDICFGEFGSEDSKIVSIKLEISSDASFDDTNEIAGDIAAAFGGQLVGWEYKGKHE